MWKIHSLANQTALSVSFQLVSGPKLPRPDQNRISLAKIRTHEAYSLEKILDCSAWNPLLTRRQAKKTWRMEPSFPRALGISVTSFLAKLDPRICTVAHGNSPQASLLYGFLLYLPSCSVRKSTIRCQRASRVRVGDAWMDSSPRSRER